MKFWGSTSYSHLADEDENPLFTSLYFVLFSGPNIIVLEPGIVLYHKEKCLQLHSEDYPTSRRLIFWGHPFQHLCLQEAVSTLSPPYAKGIRVLTIEAFFEI